MSRLFLRWFVVNAFIYNVFVKVVKSRPRIRGAPRCSGEEVHIYEAVGVHFADFVLIFA